MVSSEVVNLSDCFGAFSMSTVALSLAELTIIVSDTKTSLLFAMAIASSRLLAYCNSSRPNKEIGVLEERGSVDFAAFIVTVMPLMFMPETTPENPGQEKLANLCPSFGSTNEITLVFANSSPE